ncbi:MAG: hypothetical protein WA952_06275 [Lewinella sp.]
MRPHFIVHPTPACPAIGRVRNGTTTHAGRVLVNEFAGVKADGEYLGAGSQ